MSDYHFIHNIKDGGLGDSWPTNMRIEVSFDHDGTPDAIVQAFRHFLKSTGYADKTVDAYLGED